MIKCDESLYRHLPYRQSLLELSRELSVLVFFSFYYLTKSKKKKQPKKHLRLFAAAVYCHNTLPDKASNVRTNLYKLMHVSCESVKAKSQCDQDNLIEKKRFSKLIEYLISNANSVYMCANILVVSTI